MPFIGLNQCRKCGKALDRNCPTSWCDECIIKEAERMKEKLQTRQMTPEDIEKNKDYFDSYGWGERMWDIHFFESRKEMEEWTVDWTAGDGSVQIAEDYLTMDWLEKHLCEGPVIVIATTQMCFLSTQWLENGFRVFVHDRTGVFEIVLGDGNERTDRHIRPGHDLFRMWRNGEFGLSEVKE